MIVLTEEEWFDKYYPKEWGNWREYYNIKAYRENGVLKTGCTWLNYRITGLVRSQNNNDLLEILKYNNRESNFLKSSLFEVDDDVCTRFCGPRQPDNTCWVHATIYKHESIL